jgi:TIR domain
VTPPLPPPPKRFEFHVAFSYTRADQEYVDAVSAALPEEIKRFDYRSDESTAITWGKDLEKELVRIYKYAAMFCVVFVSKNYVPSDWTKLEREVAVRVAEQKPDYVLPVLLDETRLPELEHLIWKERVPAEKLAELIEAKIRLPPPKPWWFFLSLEVKVAAAAALLVLIVFAEPAVNLFRPARTSITSFDATARAITVHLANRGPKSATLVGQRLKFGALPINDAELRLDKSESATIAPGARDVKLTVLTLEPKCRADGTRPNRAEIEPPLGRHTVTLEIDVQESDDAPGHKTRRTATVPAAKLQPFVRKWVPSRVPRLPPC